MLKALFTQLSLPKILAYHKIVQLITQLLFGANFFCVRFFKIMLLLGICVKNLWMEGSCPLSKVKTDVLSS